MEARLYITKKECYLELYTIYNSSVKNLFHGVGKRVKLNMVQAVVLVKEPYFFEYKSYSFETRIYVCVNFTCQKYLQKLKYTNIWR